MVVVDGPQCLPSILNGDPILDLGTYSHILLESSTTGVLNKYAWCKQIVNQAN